MGQKINPISFRLGYIRGWDSNWYGGKTFAEKLVEDQEIRKYVSARIPKGAISKVVIERTLKRITLTIHTARPGVVIGKGGNEVDKIKEELKKLTSKDVQINIYEIKRPELDAKLVGESIAQQLEARISYRRAMKQAIQAAVRVGAQGIKVKLGGRLAGAEMARNEMYKEGRIPLHTIRADIDYAISEALTVYGKIGIKVWIFKGEVFGKRDLTPAGGGAAQANSERGSEGGNQNRGGRDDRRGGGRDGGRDDRRGGGRDDNRGGGDKGGRNTNNRGGGQGNNRNNNNRGAGPNKR